MSSLLHLVLATNKRICFSEKATVFQSFADAVLVQDLLDQTCIPSAWPLEHKLNVLVKPSFGWYKHSTQG